MRRVNLTDPPLTFDDTDPDGFRAGMLRFAEAQLHQCLKCLIPVNAMAMPYSSQAAMISSSFFEPPGWTM